MIVIYKGDQIGIRWTVTKGQSHCREDFSRAVVKLFVVGECNRWVATISDTSDGTIYADILPNTLPVGVYSLKAVWVKNDPRSTGYPELSTGCRCMSESERCFAVTDIESEQTEHHGDHPVLRLRTSVATYGYDGLDAYELAVLRGKTLLTEEEWIDSHGGGGLVDDVTVNGQSVVGDDKVARIYVKSVNGKSVVGAGNVEIQSGDIPFGTTSVYAALTDALRRIEALERGGDTKVFYVSPTELSGDDTIELFNFQIFHQNVGNILVIASSIMTSFTLSEDQSSCTIQVRKDRLRPGDYTFNFTVICSDPQFDDIVVPLYYHVRQPISTVTITSDTDSLSYDAAESMKDVTITVLEDGEPTDAYEVVVEDTPDWIEVVPGNGKYNVKVSQNTSSSSRSASIKFKVKDTDVSTVVYVTQRSASPAEHSYAYVGYIERASGETILTSPITESEILSSVSSGKLTKIDVSDIESEYVNILSVDSPVSERTYVAIVPHDSGLKCVKNVDIAGDDALIQFEQTEYEYNDNKSELQVTVDGILYDIYGQVCFNQSSVDYAASKIIRLYLYVKPKTVHINQYSPVVDIDVYANGDWNVN